MANFDDLKLAVEAMSGGKNTVLLDNMGMPSIMVRIPKMKISELVKSSQNQTTHPGFIVGADEKDVMYVSKFQNIEVNGRAYSLPFKDPRTGVNFEAALKLCRDKGRGWSLMPYSLWCAIALWCRENGTMPRGNNNYGCDIDKKHERGVETTKHVSSDGNNGKTAHTATGSGPDTWNHNWLPDGIADMNGNVWEWTAGMRLKKGEINIIANADVMNPDVQLTDGSSSWKSIDEKGNLGEPGKEGCLKWDWVTDKLELTKDTVTCTENVGKGCQFWKMGLHSGLSAAPELAKALLLYPDETSSDVFGGDYHWANMTDERLPIVGGYWNFAGGAGVFNVSLFVLRSNANAYIGFRSAYVDL